MPFAITVLIVGAGRFGQNYVRILAELNQVTVAGIPRVNTLIVTRTTRAAASSLADQILHSNRSAFDTVLGEEVRGMRQLETVLKCHRPELICITARDQSQGDRIHGPYAYAALDHGAVLCEKPFGVAVGDGSSARPIKKLQAHPHASRFALELPMAVVGRAMLQDHRLAPMIRDAHRIDFLWQKQNNSNDIISDLGLHPWSLLSSQYRFEVDDVQTDDQGVLISLHLEPLASAAEKKQCRIHLTCGGLFRGMHVGNRVLGFGFADGKMHVAEYSAPWEDLLAGQSETGPAVNLMQTDNPVKQHILALLRGSPIIGLDETHRSQLFLEEVAHRVQSS